MNNGDKNLISYKVYATDGEQVMVIIVPKKNTLKILNESLQHGLRVVVVDERSALVNKEFVD